jgi:hypothetical protein
MEDLKDYIPATAILDEIRAVRSELQDFRRDVQSWQQDTGERVQALESVTKPAIVGNGQPSKMSILDARITILERGKYWLAGVCSCSGLVGGILFELVRKHWNF